MKKRAILKFISLAAIFFLCISNLAFSQETIEVKIEKATMSQGIQTAYIVRIPLAILKDVQGNWVKRLQENIKTKVINVNDEYLLSDVVIGEITLDTLSIYSLFIEKEDGVVLNVFVQIDSAFFSPKEDKTHLAAEKIDNGIKNYVRRFAVDQYRYFAENDLEAEQKILKGLQDEYDKLGKDNEKLKKDISSLENNIEKTEREIASLDQEIDLKNKESLTHKTGMQALVLEDEKKAAQARDKELEKEKNKLEKDRTGLKNDISDMKSDIEKNEKTIDDNIKLQEEKQKEIDFQEEEVAKAQAVLNGIQ